LIFGDIKKSRTLYLSSLLLNINLNFGFNVLIINSFLRSFVVFFLENSAFGYGLRTKLQNTIKNLADYQPIEPKVQVISEVGNRKRPIEKKWPKGWLYFLKRIADCFFKDGL